MELKITADKKLLEAIDKLAEAMLARRATDAAPGRAPEGEEEPKPKPEPKPEPKIEAKPTPSMNDVRTKAISLIQGGKRDEVKALLEKYGAKKVTAVAEDKLAAFAAELEAL